MNVLNVNYALSEEENSVTASNKKYEEYIKAHGGTPVETTTTTIEATTITEDVFANDDKRISN